MDTNSKPCARREKECVLAMSDSLSLPSYAEYPTRRPFINTHTHTLLPYSSRAVRAFPESSGAAIISALKNLQEKIRRLELERRQHTHSSERRQHTHSPERREHTHSPERREHTHSPERPDTDLRTQLSAAETRCSRLERQLELMRKSVRHTESDRTAVLQQQVSLERVCAVDQLCKLDVLEQEYHRLTETQSVTERKIRTLERKLQEEEHQRKLVQERAAQTGLEVNRLLIQSVSPRPHKPSRIKQKKSSSTREPSVPQPHYRLSLGDVPFVTGTSTSSSHSVRANVQRVLHLMKHHHPQLCNERVLGHAPSSSGPAPSPTGSASCREELSELLLALQDEFRLMSCEQQELCTQIQSCASDRLRQNMEREMETLVKRMENKGEQIAQVRRHQAQMERLRKRSGKQTPGGGSVSVRVRPGERIRESLSLLKDMRSLQSSLRWDH
ncbi:centrosomal protein of 57 kDa isoform X2 [Rhinichthys klamathensis goyatoka]|uniref:centrosomal protein of 57 kDa isoform X2 n=1 Tax=Rhinichthys klamathensis goyatoka TaxID=3034132 RepID=UPI0024B57FAA|nr:centrosomal protein of 57 kDa isoform X2 [Rhinichthys klamathensis goyatoka]